MLVTRLKLTNWRNFLEVDIPLHDRTYLLGANASGKSNLIDVFRFLRDVCKEKGGGLQSAVEERGGISKVRCLHARRNPEVRIEVDLSNSLEDKAPRWRYVLRFKGEVQGKHRAIITGEEVFQGGVRLLCRPGQDDVHDEARLRQTHLEQVQANQGFREIVEFLGRITYQHLVPQLLTHGDRIGGQRIDNDPFGQGILERIAATPARRRETWLARIGKVLQAAVPQFEDLRFVQDEITGRHHLEARYVHHRPKAGWQREDQFSDGTLRLIGLLWALLEGETLLLLEEPELSLNDAIVEQIPVLFDRIQRMSKRRRQVILSTHSEALLRNPGIDPRGVLVLAAGEEGSKIRPVSVHETAALDAGFTIAEAVLPQARPAHADQLHLPLA